VTSLTKFFCDPGTAFLASFLLGCWALVQLAVVTYVSDNSTCDRVDMNPMKRKKPQKRLTGRRALSKPPRPFPAWAPVHLSPAAKERLLQAAERHAVREAERRVEDAWFSHRKASENRPLDEKRRELNAALEATRATAREDFRARVRLEAEEKARAKADLPARITWLS
jgi:hypothetical protein